MTDFEVLPRAKAEALRTAQWRQRRQRGLGDRYWNELHENCRCVPLRRRGHGQRNESVASLSECLWMNLK